METKNHKHLHRESLWVILQMYKIQDTNWYQYKCQEIKSHEHRLGEFC